MRNKISRNGEMNIGNITSLFLGIFGAIIIGLLALGLYASLFPQDEKNAGAFLDSLQAKIEALEENSDNNFALRGINDWVLVSWNNDVAPNDKPQKCFDKNCLCLCKNNPDKDNCQKEGLCRFTEYKTYVYSKLREEISYNGVLKISDYSATCAYTYDELMSVFISRENLDTSITIDYGIMKDSSDKHAGLIFAPRKLYTFECHLDETTISSGFSGPSGGAPAS